MCSQTLSDLLHLFDYSRGYQKHKFPLQLHDPKLKKLQNCARTNWGFSAAVWIPRGFFTQPKYLLASSALVHAQQSGHQHPLIISILQNLQGMHRKKSTAYTSRPTLLKVWSSQNCQTCYTCYYSQNWFKCPLSTLNSQNRTWQILSGNFTLENLM